MSVPVSGISQTTTVRQRLDSFGYQPRMVKTNPNINSDCPRPGKDAKQEYVSVYAPNKQGICSFLGPNSHFHEPSCNRIDNVGLDNQTLPMISFGREVIETVEEVKRDFYQNFEPVVRAAYSRGPFMVSRSGAPTRRGLQGINCGYQLTWPGRSDQLPERSAMIGLFGEPGTIKMEQWVGNQQMDQATRSLQQSIRDYAYSYECPQVFVFDSACLLMVQLRAYHHGGLKSSSCLADHCVIPRWCSDAGQSTVQYGLYALAWRGWIRLSATLLGSSEGIQGSQFLELDGSTRLYEYWSGRPMWKTTGDITVEHPREWTRYFVAPDLHDFHNTPMLERTLTGPAGCWFWIRDGFDGRRSVNDTGNVFQ